MSHTANHGTGWNEFHPRCIITFVSACKICVRSDRPAIDAQIVRGVSFRVLIARFAGLSLGGLSRHKDHLRDALTTAQNQHERESAKRGDDNLQLAHKLLDESFTTLSSARARGELRNANGAVANAIKVLSLLLHVDGQLSPGASLHLHAHGRGDVVPEPIEPLPSDAEIAAELATLTRNFDPVEIEKLRRIANPHLQLHGDFTPSATRTHAEESDA